MFHPDFRLLRCFAAIAETRSITRAAGKLNLSQPAVSGQIRELEQAMGFPLFDRTPRAVTLTEQGRALLPLVLEVLEGGEKVRRAVEGFQNAGKRHFTLGAALYTLDLPDRTALLDAFAEALPGYSYSVDNRLQFDQVPDLVNGNLDIALLLGIPVENWEEQRPPAKPGLVARELLYPARLERVVLRRRAVRLLVPAGSPLAQHERIARSALSGEKIAMLGLEHGHEFIDPVHAFLRGCGAEPFYPAEGNALAVERHAARHGLCAIGIGWFPLPAGMCLRSVDGMDFHLDLSLVVSPGASRPARRLFEFAASWQSARERLPEEAAPAAQANQHR